MTGQAPPRAPRLQGEARGIALELYAEACAEWGHLTDLVARAFRTHRQLPSGLRRHVAEAVHGMVRMHGRLEAIVGELLAGRALGDVQVSPRVRGELALLVYEVRAEGLPVELASADAQRLCGVGLDLAAAAGEDAGLGARTGLEREALRLSVPAWLLERLAADLGPEAAAALAAAMNERAPMTIRANTLKTTREALAARLLEEGVTTRPTPLAPAGLVLETRVNAFGLGAFRDGLFEVMDEGSQLVAEVVAPPPGGRVLDACAGAGGKTLALGALLGGRGRVLALDVGGKKLEELRRRARRAGLHSVTAREIEEGAPLPAEARPSSWDRVLVDAPCSGLGTLRRNPEARWRLRPTDLARFPPLQLGLLVTYAPLVAVGGRLVYATCTVVAEENDRVIDRFLAERDDFVRVPVKEIWGRERAEAVGDGLCLRLFPQVHGTDGFFAAALRRVR